MKARHILAGLAIIVAGGLAIFGLVKSHATGADQPEEKAASPVVNVQVGSLKLMTLHRYLNGYGLVEPMPATATAQAADAPLAAPAAGVVARVNVVEGQHVQKGDVLVQLNSGGATLEYAQQELARQKQLYGQHNTSLRNLQNAEAQLAQLQVVSPLSGVVVRINAKPGAAVDLNTAVVEVIDLSRLGIRANLPAADAVELKHGQEMQVLSDPPAAARVSFISPTVDTNDGTVLARAELSADSGLRPGQFVTLRIVTGVHTNCLAAPAASVVTDVKGSNVIALVNGIEATHVPVQTGFRESGWVEVKGIGIGLRPGQLVVTVGAFGLPEKTKIQVSKPDESTNAVAEAPQTGSSQEK